MLLSDGTALSMSENSDTTRTRETRGDRGMDRGAGDRRATRHERSAVCVNAKRLRWWANKAEGASNLRRRIRRSKTKKDTLKHKTMF